MRTIEELVEGYKRFRSGAYMERAELYHSLAKGQNPNIMLIGCADSRADPSDIFDAAPGQLFVVRNVANLVPPCEMGEGVHGVSAALEFAVEDLKVQHIVVMGHGLCGGVAASLKASRAEPVGQFIAPWVRLLDGARARVFADQAPNPQYALEIEGVKTSLENLMSFAFVRQAVEAGRLELHGAWFAIAHGALHWCDNETGEFVPVT